MANNSKNWTPNPTQTKFLEVLKAHEGEELTLEEINALTGENFKSGSINALVTKGLVAHGNDKEVIVQAKAKRKTYQLAKGE